MMRGVRGKLFVTAGLVKGPGSRAFYHCLASEHNTHTCTLRENTAGLTVGQTCEHHLHTAKSHLTARKPVCSTTFM